jgi:hypothetical protein
MVRSSTYRQRNVQVVGEAVLVPMIEFAGWDARVPNPPPWKDDDHNLKLLVQSKVEV